MALAEHLEKLRHFQKLSHYRSISEGAKAMGISQAGLSKSLTNLEVALETPLFLRSAEGLVLTKEGELVLQAATKILDQAAGLEANLRSLKATKIPRRLRVGMYDSIAVYFFGDLLSYINTIYKSLDLQLTVDASAKLAEAVRADEVDIAIGVNLDRKGKGDQFFPLFEDHYSFYASPKLESQQRHRATLLLHPHADDLDGISVATHLREVIVQRGAHRVYNFETLKTLTMQGLGIGVLPTKVAEPLLAQKQLIAVNLPKAPHLFGRHNIGFLATERLMRTHREFAEDIYRLGQRWTKS